MCHPGDVDEVTWAALTVVLTMLGALYTVWAYRRAGAAAGLRGTALTLLPPAAWLTGTLQMFTRITDAVVDWATSLVFSPAVWIGIALAGLSILLFGVSRMVDRRRPAAGRKQRRADEIPAGSRPAQSAVLDDELADVEAILRRRGIS